MAVTRQTAATRPNGEPVGKPTPRELKALHMVADGASLTEAAEAAGWKRTDLASILSCLYLRLGITNQTADRLSQERRRKAIQICQQNGWWES